MPKMIQEQNGRKLFLSSLQFDRRCAYASGITKSQSGNTFFQVDQMGEQLAFAFEVVYGGV